MTKPTRKILVHTCCAACASHVFSELEKDSFEIIAYYYNPQLESNEEFDKRLKDIEKLCIERKIELIVPDYQSDEFNSETVPYRDKNSIKFITDKDRYRRKRCQICNNLVIGMAAQVAKKLRMRYFSTTLLCSPYKDHNALWDIGNENGERLKINFYYKDFRKGYWNGRNYARSHNLVAPKYCGCSDSVGEGRLE